MTERMNIRRMQVPEKASEKLRLKAIERLVPEESWKAAEKEISRAREIKDWRALLYAVGDIAFVSPERLPNLTDEELTMLREPIKKGQTDNIPDRAALLRMVSPRYADPVTDQINDLTKKTWKRRYTVPWSSILNFVAGVKVFNASLVPQLSEDEWQRTMTYLQTDAEYAKMNALERVWIWSDIRLLWPDRLDQLGITTDDWKGMREYMDKSKNSYCIEHARYMMILAADTLEFSDSQGLVLEDAPSHEKAVRDAPQGLEI
jgi:hypothetical protein